MSVVNFFLGFSFLFLLSCKLESPHFVVSGLKIKEAVSFLSELEDGNKTPAQFSHYTEYLKENHISGFAWDKYWLNIKTEKLYWNLDSEQLDQLLSLSTISCQKEHQVAFAELLLGIAETKRILLFSQKLQALQQNCSSYLPEKTLKSVVKFLSDKRAEHEIAQIKEMRTRGEKIKKLLEEEEVKNSEKGLESEDLKKEVAKDLEEKLKEGLVEKKYIYTEELQLLLVNEWVSAKNIRSWDNILNLLDRPFWSDVRWIGYQNKAQALLKQTLDMEWDTYGSVANLDQDILFMFGEMGKMKDILDLVEYKKYFALPDILDWSSLWENMLIRYPIKPENGNIDSLLSLYIFSCTKEDLDSYSNLVAGWGQDQYRSFSVEYCVNLRLAEGLDTSEEGVVRGIREVLTGVDFSSDLAYETLELLFSSGSPDHPKSLVALGAVLSIYEKDKFSRDLKEWNKLLSYFSKEDWLTLMRELRLRQDKRGIEDVLDMHNQAQGGQVISFLLDDLLIMSKEEVSLSEISNTYGYSKVYLDSPELLQAFWQEVEDDIVHTPQSIDIEKFYKAKSCDFSYLKNLFQMLSQHSRENLLVNKFTFDSCLDFLQILAKSEWENMLQERGSTKMTEKNTSIATVFWRSQIFLIHSNNSRNLKVHVSKISKSNWRVMIRMMIKALSSIEDTRVAYTHTLIKSVVNKVGSVYPEVPRQAMGDFLSQKNIHQVIQKSDSVYILDLLRTTGWPHFKGQLRERGNNFISSEKMNTILFILMDSFVDQTEKDNPESVSDIVKVIGLFSSLLSEASLPRADSSEAGSSVGWYNNITSSIIFNLGSVGYKSEAATMNNNSLAFYLASLTLEKMDSNTENVYIIEENLKENSVIHVYYKKWLKELLTDSVKLQAAIIELKALRQTLGLSTFSQ